MRILIGGGSTQHIHTYLRDHPHLQESAGWFTTPNTLYPVERYRFSDYLGVDNGAYTNFDEKMYVSMIARLSTENYPVKWVTLPDVVADAQKTLTLFEKWVNLIDLPKAFVGQDGIEDFELHWDTFQCLFIGGSTQWKLSQSARDLIKEARNQGKYVHMGRVNSQKRIRYAFQIGCDSVDGSAYSRWWKKCLIPDLNYLYHLKNQTFFDFGEVH